MKIGFIGLGMMGAGMASNLQKAGHDLVVHDLTRQAASKHLTPAPPGPTARVPSPRRATSCSPRCRRRPTCRRSAPARTG